MGGGGSSAGFVEGSTAAQLEAVDSGMALPPFGSNNGRTSSWLASFRFNTVYFTCARVRYCRCTVGSEVDVLRSIICQKWNSFCRQRWKLSGTGTLLAAGRPHGLS